MKTTIQLTKPTLERLAKLKRFERESYDDVLNFVLDEYEEEVFSDEELESIKRGLDDIQKGNVHSIESVAKELGIKL